MSIILNALSKAKRERDQEQATEDSQLYNELAYQQGGDDETEAPEREEQQHSAARGNTGALIFAGAVLVSLAIIALAGVGGMLLYQMTISASRTAPQLAAPALVQQPQTLNKELAPHTTPADAPAITAEEPPDQAPIAHTEATPKSADADASAPENEVPMQIVELNFEMTPEAEAVQEKTQADAQDEAPQEETGTSQRPKRKVIYSRGAKPIESIEEVTINGIIWSKEAPKAMVCEQVVYIGDEIRGLKIIDIQSESVVVEFKGEEYTLFY
ncbi:hypothetical protein JXA32_02845 [Candidatus Sumerlaeota bacterium]|nr:hypothetical protein [Candidatus Sumerlaeota bacterium]